MSKYTPMRITTASVLTVLVPAVSAAYGQHVRSVGPIHAKGVAVLESRFPSCSALHSVELRISRVDETRSERSSNDVSVLAISGSTILPSNESAVTSVVLPVVGRFDMGVEAFLFPCPGRYALRWIIRPMEPTCRVLEARHMVDVLPSTDADEEFLARMASPGFVSTVLDVDTDEAWPADLRALGVIKQLIECALADPARDGSRGTSEAAADAMIALARELPTASYAPYAALWAGCVYMGHYMRSASGGDSGDARVDVPVILTKAEGALDFARRHGDDFLKPRVLCSQAVLAIVGGAGDDAKRLLSRAAESGNEQDAVIRAVAELRRAVNASQKEK